MSYSKPAPAMYGSAMNPTSMPQRFAGLLVDKGYVKEQDLDEIGFFEVRNISEEPYDHPYNSIGKILENEGLGDELDFEDESFRSAVRKSVLRAGLRKELNEGYGGSVQLNRSDSLTEYLVDSGLVSKEEHIDNYTEFFEEEGIISGEYEEEEIRESMAKVVTKAMLDAEKQDSEVDEDFMRPAAKYIWDEMSDEMGIKPVPVQIPGSRGYWAEPVTKEGLMLGAEESEETMTAVAYLGLVEEFYDEIVADENKESELYSVMEVEVELPEEIRDEIIEEVDEENIPETVRYLVMNPESPQVNKESDKGINLNYHRLVEEVEKHLTEEFNGEVGELVARKYFEETDKIRPAS